MVQLRDYQQKAVDETLRVTALGKRPLLFSPTGSGKSLIIAALVKNALDKNKRVMICAHRAKLLTQLAGTIKWVADHEASFILPGKKYDPTNPVQLTMVQSAKSRKLPPGIDNIIIDECHVGSSFAGFKRVLDTYLGSIWALSNKTVVGLTATPWRTNKKEGMCWLFNHVIKTATPRELIDDGYLTKPRIFTYDPMIDLDSIKTDNANDDFNVKDLINNCTEEYNADVISKWEGRAAKLKTIVFCVGREQAKSFNEIFTTKGYTSAIVDGTMSNKKREQLFEDYHNDKFQILININVLTEGFDETSIECVLLARPTRSAALFAQMAGRGLRLHEGKNEVLIIDCGGCATWLLGKQFHGSIIEDVIDISSVYLCPKWVKKGDAPSKKCPECEKEIRASSMLCPHCGHEMQPKYKTPSESFVFFPDLIELDKNIQAEKEKYSKLRKALYRAFIRRECPKKADEKVHKKLDEFLPTDYYRGAIFNGRTETIYQAAYRYYLAVYISDKSTINFYQDLEFGAENAERCDLMSPTGYMKLTGYTRNTLDRGVLDQRYVECLEEGYDPLLLNLAYEETAKKLANF